MAPGAPPPAPAQAAPEPREQHEGAPLDQRVFESWEAFHSYLEGYARRSFQLFRKRTSTSVKLRNRRMAERFSARAKTASDNSARASDSARLIPDKYGNYSLTLVCTHSGAFVSRGTGRRDRQDVRATCCNVQINACLKLADPVTNRYEVNVTRALLTHNHRVDKETFMQYSNSRLNLSDSLLNCVELMRKTGVKPKDIRTYIMENSNCTPTLKDVRNILQRLRNQEEAATAAAMGVAAAIDHQPAQTVSDESRGRRQKAAVTLSPPDEVLRDYRLATSGNSHDEIPDPVDPTMQFKVAHAMGKAVATLLADAPATQFAGAFRVMEVAMNIVRERREEAPAAGSEEGGSEAMTDVESARSAGPAVAIPAAPWTLGP
ncbi:hypothetical protein PRIC1_008547 [Phytophthora ramorum]|nr:hypothetical protein KRP23_6687 [Phytophthora ramorum]KAH7500963.1 hypothetical protein KRP22_10207 [Phytophthora ramorum]